MKQETTSMNITIKQPHLPATTEEQPTDPQRPPTPVSSVKTPQQFYAEITKRPDVRAILKDLATG